MDPLTKAQQARDELHKSVYWPAAKRQQGRNHLWLADVAQGELIDMLTPPPPSVDLVPVFAADLMPNWWSHQDDPPPGHAHPDYQAVWIYPHSPSTPYRSPDSAHTVQQRYLLLDPRFEDANGLAGCDEWWFEIERMWPGTYPARNHGAWGRTANFHNVAGDAGPDGGIGWAFGPGDSALALDWLSENPYPTFALGPAAGGGLNVPLPVPGRDVWHKYRLHFVAGRTDGSTVRPGACRIEADGEVVFDKQNLNTVWRAQAPDGQWYTQRWMQLWEGDYTSHLPVPSTLQLALTRIGRSAAEAAADRPVAAATNIASQYYKGSGTNFGAPSILQVGTKPVG